MITKILSVNGITYVEYTCSIKEEKHGLEFEYWEFSLLCYFTFIVEGKTIWLSFFFNLYCPQVVEESSICILFYFYL